MTSTRIAEADATFSGPVIERERAVVRAGQRVMWDAAAGRRVVDVEAEPNAVTRRLLDLALIAPDSSVLDMACGSGDPSIAAARLAWRGQVLGLELSPRMIAEARRAAGRAGLQNVSFRLVDDETVIPVADRSLDVVLCRFGLMFMPNPERALRAWARATVAGGRIAVCTHGVVPAFELTMLEVERRSPALAAALDWRRVIALSSEIALSRTFESAGLSAAVHVQRASQATVPGIGACWDAMLRRSPLRDALDGLPPAESGAIRDACLARLAEAAIPVDELFSGDVFYAVSGASASSGAFSSGDNVKGAYGLGRLSGADRKVSMRRCT